MSRADVLVDADRAETHLLDPAVVFSEVDDDGSHLQWSCLPDMPVHNPPTADRSAS